jgi:hypothetical protein
MTDETEGVTFFQIAQANAGQERRSAGRYAQEIGTKVTGVPTYSQLPENSPWREDPVGPEPPLSGPLDPGAADLKAAAPPEPPAPPKAPAVTRREAR